MIRFFSIGYSLLLVFILELIIQKPHLWWFGIATLVVHSGILVYFVFRKSGKSRKTIPSIIVLGLTLLVLFFIGSPLWRHVLAIVIPILLGNFFYLLLEKPTAPALRRLSQVLELVTVLLASGVCLSLGIFLRFPWYVIILIFAFFLTAFNTYLPGPFLQRFFARERWLPILIATEVFTLIVFLPINIFSRTVIVAFVFHLSNLLGRSQQIHSKQLVIGQISIAIIMIVLVLITSRWL